MAQDPPLSAYVHRSTLVDASGTQEEGVNKVAGYVWDSVGLQWVKATQAGGGGGGGGLVQLQDAYGNNISSTTGSLNVNVTNGGSGGGGTQYAQGTTNATPTGTVAMGMNPSNVLNALSQDASGNLNVNLAAGSISGGNAAASPTGSAVPGSADYLGFNSAGNLIGVSAAAPLPVALSTAQIAALAPLSAVALTTSGVGGTAGNPIYTTGGAVSTSPIAVYGTVQVSNLSTQQLVVLTTSQLATLTPLTSVQVYGNSTPAGGSAIPTNAVPVMATLMVQNQITGMMDIAEEGDNTADNDAPGNYGLLGAECYPRMFDGTYWQRQRGTLAGGLNVNVTNTVPTVEAINQNALSSDNPISHFITGDPSGDFANVDLMQALFDPQNGYSLTVAVNNQPKQDVNGNLILSDAPTSQTINAPNTSLTYIIDTQGYTTVCLSMGTMAATLTGCNAFNGTYGAISAYPVALGAMTATLAVNTNWMIPAVTRYIKITVTTAGWCTYFLRNVPIPASYTTTVPTGTPTAPTLNAVNLTQIGGTAQTAGGLALNSLASTNGQSISQTIITSTTAAVVQVKASAGRITMLQISNGAAAVAYLHLQNASAATTATAAFMTFAVPAVAGTNISVYLPEGGLYMSAGIAFTVSGAIASGDATILVTPSLVVNISYI